MSGYWDESMIAKLFPGKNAEVTVDWSSLTVIVKMHTLVGSVHLDHGAIQAFADLVGSTGVEVLVWGAPNAGNVTGVNVRLAAKNCCLPMVAW